jgi:hypothetical protein
MESGKEIICTPDHQFLTLNGWRKALDLKDALCYAPSIWKPSLLAKAFKSLMEFDFTGAGSTFKGKDYDSIVPYGNSITEKSLKITMSIIWTRIETIIRSLTYNFCLDRGTYPYMAQNVQGYQEQRSWLRRSGTSQKKVGNGTRSITLKIALISGLRKILLSVNSVVNRLSVLPKLSLVQNFVIPIAKHERCVSVSRMQEASDVFCLTVPSLEAFVVEGNITVSNCVDTLRYSLMSRPYSNPIERREDKPIIGMEGLTFERLLREEKKRRANRELWN